MIRYRIYHAECSGINPHTLAVERGTYGVCAADTTSARFAVSERMAADGYRNTCIRSVYSVGSARGWAPGDVLCYQMA